MPAMLDLCCGLGGASAAMKARGWSVTTVDIDAELHPSICADIRKITAINCRVDLLWASPPCEEFTRLALPWKRKNLEVLEPDLSIVRAVRRLIHEAQPRFWIVENTTHARKYLTPIFGRVLAAAGGHVLWGNVPVLVQDLESHKACLGPLPGGDRERYLERSRIPFEMSEAIARSIERALT